MPVVEAAGVKLQRKFGGVMRAVAIQSCQSTANRPMMEVGGEFFEIK
jgi:hypothetical protein